MKRGGAKLGSIVDVANAVRLASADDNKALGRTVFLIGAGCSASAGIPAVPEMARWLAIRLAGKARAPADACKDGNSAYLWLAERKQIRNCYVAALAETISGSREIDWFQVYDAAFADHFNTPDDARELFSELIDAAGGQINWAHLCLGELVRQRLVSTIMSTNFDQLALAGLVRSGVLPVVCDGIESLTRIRGAPHHPQLIELHGSRHTYRLRNSPKEVAELAQDEQTIAAIGSIFQDLRAFVIVGYGGREDGIMDLLIKAAERFPDKRLVWISYSKDPARISDKANELLATSRNSILLVDQDADSFFLRLLQSLEIGAPETIRNPLFLASIHASTLTLHGVTNIAEADSITKEVERCRAEISAMEMALQRHRNARSIADNAVVRAQELRLTGNLSDALQTLLDVPEYMKNEKIWLAIGEIGFEHGTTSANRQSLEASAAALRKVIDLYKDSKIEERLAAEYKLADTLRKYGDIQGNCGAIKEAIYLYEKLLNNRDRLSDEYYFDVLHKRCIALSILGEREDDKERLTEAVLGYRELLTELTRGSAPLLWAKIQTNLGATLQSLGIREDNLARLEEAVAAFREALKERTHERVPLEWAETQNNLGNALTSFGQRESGTTRLEEAVIAYREALTEHTRGRMPIQWAITQNNLGNALKSLGERESGTARLEEAVTAYCNALEEFEKAGATFYIESARENLTCAQALLVERRNSPEGT